MSPAVEVTLAQFLQEQRALVDQELERLLPRADEYPVTIHRAMRHSVFAGGKRLRPVLCLEVGRLASGEEKPLRRVAAALELIHTYSLIHDDLPALDNDDLRRGQPTCHRVFGEAMAILAGDALLTLALHALAEPGLCLAERQLRMISDLTRAIGTPGGMVAGQVADLEAANGAADAEALEFIHRAKTGAFIAASLRAGALVAGAAEADLDALAVYGEKIGLAFQIADDLLDVSGTSAELGKTPGKDDRQRKATYPGRYGIETSRRRAASLVREATAALERFGARAQRLREMAQYLIERTA